ncbi:hypothetical protein [Allorhizocola rhizosphaerae]
MRAIQPGDMLTERYGRRMIEQVTGLVLAGVAVRMAAAPVSAG